MSTPLMEFKSPKQQAFLACISTCQGHSDSGYGSSTCDYVISSKVALFNITFNIFYFTLNYFLFILLHNTVIECFEIIWLAMVVCPYISSTQGAEAGQSLKPKNLGPPWAT